jgi:hypothetical protein
MNLQAFAPAETPIEKAHRLANLCQTILREGYSRAQVVFDNMPNSFYRFEVCIPDSRIPEDRQVFVIEFTGMEIQATGQTDEGWRKAFLEKVDEHLKDLEEVNS